MTKTIVRVVCALAAVAASALVVSVAVDDFKAGGDEVSWGIVILTGLPCFAWVAYLVPEFIFARDANQRNLAYASPFSALCQAVFFVIFATGIGSLAAGWWGALIGLFVGGVLAYQSFATMRWYREKLQPPGTREPPEGGPTRRDWIKVIVKSVLLWSSILLLSAGAAYALAGLTSAIVTFCVVLTVILLLYVRVIVRVKRARAAGLS